MGNKQSTPEEQGEGGEQEEQESRSKNPAFLVTPVCDLDHLQSKNAVVVLRLEPESKSSQRMSFALFLRLIT
jgi:hypothetical protein